MSPDLPSVKSGDGGNNATFSYCSPRGYGTYTRTHGLCAHRYPPNVPCSFGSIEEVWPLAWLPRLVHLRALPRSVSLQAATRSARDDVRPERVYLNGLIYLVQLIYSRQYPVTLHVPG